MRGEHASQPKGVDYTAVAESNQFKSLIESRKKFTVPYTIFFLVFYFLLPICTSYSKFLNTPAIGDISWVWIFAFAQFVMTFVLCTIYMKRSTKFDAAADDIIKEQLGEGERAS